MTKKIKLENGEEKIEHVAMINNCYDFFMEGFTFALPGKLLEFQRKIAVLRAEEIVRLNERLSRIRQENEGNDQEIRGITERIKEVAFGIPSIN